MAGKRLGIVKETLGEGVSAQVKEAVLQVRRKAAKLNKGAELLRWVQFRKVPRKFT
jgi:hypothetical protein